jgi:HSP20 family protein
MTLIKYNPLNNFIPATFGDMVENMLNESPARERIFMPAVDILKNDKAVILHVIAPGMTKENFTLDLKEDRLVITGERILPEEEKESYKTIESRFGKFQRVFKLNKEVNTEKISARYEEGILKITLPLNEKVETKKTIKIS